MQRKPGLKFISSFLVLVAVLGACEKKREERFLQGDGEYVYPINEFQGKTYTLKTGKRRTPGVTTRADELVVGEGSSVIRSFDSVEFDVQTEFGNISSGTMNNFDFYGRENSEYKVEMSFTEGNLIVSKVAANDEIPSNERTYAIPVSPTHSKVPFMGFPLTKLTTERVVDGRGKATNTVKTFEKKFLKDATHFRIDFNSPKKLDAALKLDMFPASFFGEKDEWYYELTIVDRPMSMVGGLELGYQLGQGKVRFYKTQNSILALDVNIPEEAAGQDGEKLNTVLEIPVKWLDYRLVTSGEDAYLKEDAFDNIDAGAKFWKDRQYALLQLNKVLDISSASTDNIKIKRLEVSDDYLSFIVFDSVSKLSLHYSFAKENRAVAGRTYPLEDTRKFGFFRGIKSQFGGTLNSSEEATYKRQSIQRMYPKDGVVTFHYTDNTPKDPLFVEAINEAVLAWNNTFTVAAKGTKYENNPIKIVLDSAKPVKNGDARYHKVSFYGYEIESRLLGYGPSVTDDRSGETFSSTNHIYLRNYRESILRNLVSYIRFRLGKFNNLELDGIKLPNQVLTVSGNSGFDFKRTTANTFSPILDQNTELVTELLAAELEKQVTIDAVKAPRLAETTLAKMTEAANSPHNNPQTVNREFLRLRKNLESGQITDEEFGRSLSHAFSKHDPDSCGYMASMALTYKEIEDVCLQDGDEFKDYVENLLSISKNGESIYRLDSEREVLHACAQKLMKPTLIATLVHEFGHNFGMTHNFAGSSDGENFDRDENGLPTVRTTSVMDYSHPDADRGFAPGPYDIAAIRYAYYEAVEVQNVQNPKKRRVIDISTDKTDDLRPIEKRLAGKIDASSEVLRPFAYCWDRDISALELPTEDPGCKRRDQGSTPVTQARSYIDGFASLLITSANRFDNSGLASSAAIGNAAYSNYYLPLKVIYDKYRFMLYNIVRRNEALGKLDDPYLDKRPLKDVETQVFTAAGLAELDAITARVDSLSATELELVLDKLTQSSTNKDVTKELKLYRIASKIISKFFVDIMFLESQYCVALSSNGDAFEAVGIETFEKSRTLIENQYRKDIRSCEEGSEEFKRLIESQLKESGISREVSRVVSVGNPVRDIKYSSDTEKLTVYADVRRGLQDVRQSAILMLNNRSGVLVSTGTPQGLLTTAKAGFFPGLLDDESVRQDILGRLSNRTIKGVSSSRLTALATAKIGAKVTPASHIPENLPFFLEEAGLVQSVWGSYVQGAPAPNAPTTSRIEGLLSNRTDAITFFGFNSSQVVEYVFFGNTVYYATSRNPQIAAVMQQLSETQNQLNALAQADVLNTSAPSLAGFNSKIQDIIEGYYKLAAQNNNPASSLNNVLYKTRLCLTRELAKKFKINVIVEEVLGNLSVTDCAAGITDYEKRSFYDPAEAMLEYVSNASPTQKVSSDILNQILNKVGLPEFADDTVDPEAELKLLLKSRGRLGQFGGLLNRSATLSPLESSVALRVVSKIDEARGQPAFSLESATLSDMINKSREEEIALLAPLKPYAEQLKDKNNLLQSIIINQR